MIRLFIRDDNLHVFMYKSGHLYIMYAKDPTISEEALPIFKGEVSYLRHDTEQHALACVGRIMAHQLKMVDNRLSELRGDRRYSYEKAVELFL